MNFGFTEEQELLRSEVRKLLDERSPIPEVRRVAATPEGYSPELWKELAALGWLGLIVPERFGGAGQSFVDWVVLLEETGRSLFPSPLISNTLAAWALLEGGSSAQQGRWLPPLVDGSAIGTLALLEESDDPTPRGVALRGEPEGDGFVLRGAKHFVPEAGRADLFVVAFRAGDDPSDTALALVEAETRGVSSESVTTIDPTKRSGILRLEGVRVEPRAILGDPGVGSRLLERLVDRGAVSVTAEMVGACEATLALTTKYAKDRVQFGQPIGHYQGVKHPLAEAYVDVESMKSLLYYAAWALDARPDKVPLAASRAKALASEAFTRLGTTAIQLHGAIGYTQECDVQLYLRRSKWARPMYGDETFHLDRVATLGGF